MSTAPGFKTKQESIETEILWAGNRSDDHASHQVINLASTVVDAGNSPTTDIRGGNILSIKTSDGLAYLYDPDASDGTENPVGILEKTVTMLRDCIATSIRINMLVTGRLKVAELINADANALSVLAGRGFIFDGVAPNPAIFGRSTTRQQTVITDKTLLAADSGSLFIATTADVDFVLPTIANGLYFEFLRLENFELLITGSTNIIGLNGVAFSTITVTTTAEQIGAYVRVEAMFIDGVLKWLPTIKHGPGFTLSYA